MLVVLCLDTCVAFTSMQQSSISIKRQVTHWDLWWPQESAHSTITWLESRRGSLQWMHTGTSRGLLTSSRGLSYGMIDLYVYGILGIARRTLTMTVMIVDDIVVCFTKVMSVWSVWWEGVMEWLVMFGGRYQTCSMQHAETTTTGDGKFDLLAPDQKKASSSTWASCFCLYTLSCKISGFIQTVLAGGWWVLQVPGNYSIANIIPRRPYLRPSRNIHPSCFRSISTSSNNIYKMFSIIGKENRICPISFNFPAAVARLALQPINCGDKTLRLNLISSL